MGILFTDSYIKALKTKKYKGIRFEKYERGGFGIRVSTTGTKTWLYRYRIGQKTYKIMLGHYPHVGLKDARTKFQILRGHRMEGENPRELINKPPVSLATVETLAHSWFEGYILKSHKDPSGVRQHIEGDIIPLFGSFELEKIRTVDICEGLDTIVKRGSPMQANKVLGSLKALFNYGVSRGNLTMNPAASIKPKYIGGEETPRTRVLSLLEIKQLWNFLGSVHCDIGIHAISLIKLLILTGVRTQEIRLATWDEFNFDESLWTIPAAHYKTGLIHKVHLNPHALAIFKCLKDYNNISQVIFNKNPKKPLAIATIPRIISRIQQIIGMEKWCAHDLRRSFATHLGESLSVSPVVIEKCLGHKLPRIIETYNRNEMLPERAEALNKWGALIDNLVFRL